MVTACVNYQAEISFAHSITAHVGCRSLKFNNLHFTLTCFFRHLVCFVYHFERLHFVCGVGLDVTTCSRSIEFDLCF